MYYTKVIMVFYSLQLICEQLVTAVLLNCINHINEDPFPPPYMASSEKLVLKKTQVFTPGTSTRVEKHSSVLQSDRQTHLVL